VKLEMKLTTTPAGDARILDLLMRGKLTLAGVVVDAMRRVDVERDRDFTDSEARGQCNAYGVGNIRCSKQAKPEHDHHFVRGPSRDDFHRTRTPFARHMAVIDAKSLSPWALMRRKSVHGGARIHLVMEPGSDLAPEYEPPVGSDVELE